MSQPIEPRTEAVDPGEIGTSASGLAETGDYVRLGSFPGGTVGIASAIVGDKIYLFGGSGAPGGAAPSRRVFRFAINGDGTLGPMTEMAPMLRARALHAIAVAAPYVYILGGKDASGAILTSVERGTIGQDGSIGGWTEVTPMWSARAGASAVAANGFLIVFGGCNGGACRSQNFARIAANGALTWFSGPTYPVDSFGGSVVARGDKLYSIPGGATPSNMTFYTTVVSTGPLGWTRGPDLVRARTHATIGIDRRRAAVVSGGVIQQGNPATLTNSTEAAFITDAGTMLSFNETGPLPTALAFHSVSQSSNGALYLLGGVSRYAPPLTTASGIIRNSPVFTVAINQPAITVGTDGMNAFWGNGATIVKSPCAGSSPVARGLGAMWSMAVDGTDVYFTRRFDNAVFRSRGNIITEIARSNGTYSVAVNATHIYWGAAERIHRTLKTGGGIVTMASTVAPQVIAVDGTHLYWTNASAGTISRLRHDDPAFDQTDGIRPAAEVIASGQRSPWGLKLHAGRVYWTNFGSGAADGEVRSMALDGSDQQLLASGITSPIDLAVDDTRLFIASSGSLGSILQMANAPGAPLGTVARRQNQPSSITIADHGVFWSNVGDGSIRFLHK